MILDTFEDVEREFPNEEAVRKYLINLRWGQWAKCTKCGNNKAYFIKNGERFKCANNKCYYKFSVITKTLMASTHLPLITWMKAVWYFTKKRGNLEWYELQSICDIKDSSGRIEKSLSNKISFAWKYADHTLSDIELINEVFKKLFTLADMWEGIAKESWHSPYHISNIDSINDKYQFNILLTYCKRRLFFCSYIWMNFATPGEIMTEVFMFLYDKEIKDYDASFIIKIINCTIQRMWIQYKRDHPNLWRSHVARQRETKRDAIRNLKKSYLLSLAKKRKEYAGLTSGELKKSTEILNKIREEIKQKRKKHNKLYDFESHFN